MCNICALNMSYVCRTLITYVWNRKYKSLDQFLITYYLTSMTAPWSRVLEYCCYCSWLRNWITTQVNGPTSAWSSAPTSFWKFDWLQFMFDFNFQLHRCVKAEHWIWFRLELIDWCNYLLKFWFLSIDFWKTYWVWNSFDCKRPINCGVIFSRSCGLHTCNREFSCFMICGSKEISRF